MVVGFEMLSFKQTKQNKKKFAALVCVWPNVMSRLSLSLPTTTDDEMFADTFKITESEDGIFYEVEGKVSSGELFWLYISTLGI